VILWVLLGGVLALVLVLSVFASIVYWGSKTGVPPHPRSRSERRAVGDLLQKANTSPGIIYELGCGWGGLARTLAKRFPQHQIEAFEISPIVARWAKLMSWRIPNLRVHTGNFMKTDLRDAKAIVCYLMIEATQELGQKLDRELARGTPVVSVVFRFRGRPIQAHVTPRGWQPGDVCLYAWSSSPS